MTAEASPSAGALRMRRQRARRLRGVRIVQVECSDEAVDALIRCGKLNEDDTENPEALAFAIGLQIEEMLVVK